MIYIILALLIISIYLGFRLFYVEKQVVSLVRQLKNINKKSIDKKITIGLLNKKIEVLAENINEVIQIKKQSEANKVKIENELRQTIANMSHDLRTPLTSIKGYIQFLKLEDITEEEKRQYLNVAEERVKTLEILLNDFYELSLIESLDYKIELKKLNINRVTEEIILEKYSDFTNRNIMPKIQMPKENIFIIADKKALERVIENLLSNAIKYAKDRINIYLEVEEGMVLFKISNTTQSLTSLDVEHIFDRFYMADKIRSGNGTGLGLAITKGLVEKMNGTIKAGLKDNMFIICFKLNRVM
ncbi:HAMP domain-containing histidine kinase [Clostridium sp. SHJSY1]|uniref:sensor histidine kinase n=1 Tax=Clostridium sp. SHJSY1 TaxID=2942483 RepID=UPI002874EC0F|nr:HAMP domain-containing sensor histidine kinase [Clostridium sp. SHJSY1]MDS0525517.1 HAMP domain-containing histidine kinase [Clostridium sp. SHJSY1]